MLLIKSIPIVTLKVCLGHASQPNGDAQLLYDVREKNTLDSFKICWTSKPPTVFATFLELPPFFNSNKVKQGGRTSALRSCWPWPGCSRRARPARTGLWSHRPQGTVPPTPAVYFFLRHCSSDFRKPSHKNPSEQ